MIQDFIAFAFNVILRLVFVLVNIILIPIDTAITAALPALSQALGAVGNFFGVVSQYLGFAISITGIPIWVFVFLASYYIFKLTMPINFYVMKLALAWYSKLKH